MGYAVIGAALLAAVAGAGSGTMSASAVASGAVGAAAQVSLSNPSPIVTSDEFERELVGPITINASGAAAQYPATLQVAGVTGRITDVSVFLHGFQHAAPDGLDIMLVGPQGQKMMLMSDTGGNTPVVTPANSGLGFSDTGTPMPDNGPIGAGAPWKPSNFEAVTDAFDAPAPASAGIGTSFSVFDGTDPNGSWQLFIMDDTPGGAGSMAGTG